MGLRNAKFETTTENKKSTETEFACLCNGKYKQTKTSQSNKRWHAFHLLAECESIRDCTRSLLYYNTVVSSLASRLLSMFNVHHCIDSAASIAIFSSLTLTQHTNTGTISTNRVIPRHTSAVWSPLTANKIMSRQSTTIVPRKTDNSNIWSVDGRWSGVVLYIKSARRQNVSTILAHQPTSHVFVLDSIPCE